MGHYWFYDRPIFLPQFAIVSRGHERQKKLFAHKKRILPHSGISLRSLLLLPMAENAILDIGRGIVSFSPFIVAPAD